MNLQIAGEWVARAAEVMWEAGVAASVLIAVVAALILLLGKKLRANWRFALWGIVLVRLLLPVTPESGLSLFNAPKLLAGKGEIAAEQPVFVQPGEIQMSNFNAAPVPIPIPETVAPRPRIDWVTMAACAWVAGAVLLGLRLFIGATGLQWRLRCSAGGKISDEHAQILQSAADEIGTRVKCRIIVTNVVSSPALCGVFRPTLLIPAGFENRLGGRELRHVFLHELAHVKRGDLLTNALMVAAQVLHWWNPLVWLALRQMRLERELACDEMVLRATSGHGAGGDEARAYGETILRLMEGISGRPRIASVGIAEGKNAVRKRLEQIAEYGKRRTVGGFASAAIILALTVTGLTNAQNDTDANATARIDQAATVQADVEILLQRARNLLQQSRFEDAEQKLMQAQKMAPQHLEIAALLKRVKEAQFADDAIERDRWSTDPAGVNTLIKKERTHTSRGRQAIVKKLNEIVIDHYEVPNAMPLTEIIKDLHAIARKLDPEKKGVNFIFSSRLENPGIIGSVPTIDPLTGEPPLKVGDYLVTISPPLRSVTLHGLLDAIMEVAVPPKSHEGAPPLRYALEEYAVVIGQRRVESEPLYTRTFKVNPNTFIQGLDQTFGRGEVQTTSSDLQGGLRRLLMRAGVDFGTNRTILSQNGDAPSAPQKALFYNDRTGVLFTRATLRELELVEKAIQLANTAQRPQILFAVEAIELKTMDELDFLTKKLMLPDGFRTRLTAPEFRQLRKDVSGAGFKWAKGMKVTTLSGRGARIEIQDSYGVDAVAEYEAADEPITVKASTYDGRGGKTEASEAVVYDGQTIVLMPSGTGDRLKPSRAVFLTVTLIDPAGNRVNSPEDEFGRKADAAVP